MTVKMVSTAPSPYKKSMVFVRAVKNLTKKNPNLENQTKYGRRRRSSSCC